MMIVCVVVFIYCIRRHRGIQEITAAYINRDSGYSKSWTYHPYLTFLISLEKFILDDLVCNCWLWLLKISVVYYEAKLNDTVRIFDTLKNLYSRFIKTRILWRLWLCPLCPFVFLLQLLQTSQDTSAVRIRTRENALSSIASPLATLILSGSGAS